MKKIIPITALVLSMVTTGVNAQVVITENKMNMNTGILSIKGTTDEPNTAVTLNIPKVGITPENLQGRGDAGDYIVYSGQVSSDENKEFSFTVDFNGADEGVYDVYVGYASETAGEDTVAKAEDTKTSYTMSTNYETLIGELNAKAAIGETEFDAVFDANEEKLFICPDVEVTNKDVVKDVLYNFAKDHGFVASDSALNMTVYKTALAAQLIKDGKVKDAQTLADDMYVLKDGVLAQHGAVDDFNTYINTDDKREYFGEKFKACKTVEDFENELINAMILTIVRYPGNVTTLQDVFEKYNKYLGANTQYAGLDDYSFISGKTYSDIKSCIKEFNDKVGNGGGGGSSGGSSSSSDLGLGVVLPGGTSPNAGTLGIKFEDLNPVPWAYSAISELFEKNIISGKSETRFAPNDRITREEFATLLVKVSGVSVNNSTNAFSDVKNDAWYKGFVNTAFEKGFCNGVSKGVFGTGMEITRQDMCVMAYNVLKALGREVANGEMVFADAAEISEYAKGPVSALNKAGVVNGVGNNKFNPKGNATRAEAAVIIYKVLKYIG